MSELIPLCPQVMQIVRIGFNADRNLFDNLQAVALKSNDFSRIVRQQANCFETEISEYLGSQTVFAQVRRKTQLLIGFNGIVALLLKLIGFDFGCEADAAAFLAHINDYALSSFRDLAHGLMQLRATIATARAENVASQAFAMHSHEHIFFSSDLAINQSQMMLPVQLRAIQVKIKVAIIGGHFDDFHPFDQFFTRAAEMDQIGNRANFEPMLFRKFDQVWEAGH